MKTALTATAAAAAVQIREYTDPTCDTLLPELDPQLRGRVKTLVLDLEDVLVHKNWSRGKGWQVIQSTTVQAMDRCCCWW